MIKKILRSIELMAVSVLIVTLIAACSTPIEFREREPDWSDWSEALLIDGVNFVGIDRESTPLSATDLKLYQSIRERTKNEILEVEYQYTVVGNLIKTSDVPDEGYFIFSIALIYESGEHIDSWEKRMIPGYYFGFGNPNLLTIGDTVNLESSKNVGSKSRQPSIVKFTDIVEFDKNDLIRLYLDAVTKSLQSTLQAVLKSARSNVEYVLSLDPNNTEALYLLDMIDYKEEHGELPEIFWDFYQESEDSSITNGSGSHEIEEPLFEDLQSDNQNTDNNISVEITNWREGYTYYISQLSKEIGSSPSFYLFDMGYDYPIMCVVAQDFSALLAYYDKHVYNFGGGSRYEDGFVSGYYDTGFAQTYFGYYISDKVEWMSKNNVEIIPKDAEFYTYHMEADDYIGHIDYVGEEKYPGIFKGWRIWDEIKERHQGLASNFDFSNFSQNSTTNINYINEFEWDD